MRSRLVECPGHVPELQVGLSTRLVSRQTLTHSGVRQEFEVGFQFPRCVAPPLRPREDVSET